MALSFNIALAISGAREIRLAIWTRIHPSSRLIVYAVLCYAAIQKEVPYNGAEGSRAATEIAYLFG